MLIVLVAAEHISIMVVVWQINLDVLQHAEI